MVAIFNFLILLIYYISGHSGPMQPTDYNDNDINIVLDHLCAQEG